MIYVHLAVLRIDWIVAAYRHAHSIIDVYKTMHNSFTFSKNEEILDSFRKRHYPDGRIMSISALPEEPWAGKYKGTDTIALNEKNQKIYKYEEKMFQLF